MSENKNNYLEPNEFIIDNGTPLEWNLNKRYRIIKKIDEGGSSSVFLAKDLYSKTNVVIKILSYKKNQNHKANLLRFQSEMRLMANFNHYNLVPILDAFETRMKRPAIVMKYISNVTLHNYIHDGKIVTLNEGLNFFLQILDGIIYLHEQNIVHRDLKPENILIDENNHVFITDFGLTDYVDSDFNITRENYVVGTIMYLPPEYLDKTSQKHIQGDIYSLGLILYEMITGKYAIDQEYLLNGKKIIMWHKTKIPQKITLEDELTSSGINQIILNAVNKDLKLRYKTVQDFKKDIIKLQAHQKIDRLVSQYGSERIKSTKKKLNNKLLSSLFIYKIVLVTFIIVLVILMILLVILWINP